MAGHLLVRAERACHGRIEYDAGTSRCDHQDTLNDASKPTLL